MMLLLNKQIKKLYIEYDETNSVFNFISKNKSGFKDLMYLEISNIFEIMCEDQENILNSILDMKLFYTGLKVNLKIRRIEWELKLKKVLGIIFWQPEIFDSIINIMNRI